MDMVLVFTRMKHAADRLAKQLEYNGVKTATLHSNRSQNQRLKALKDFKSGAVRVLVATDIAARGIDVDGISHVVNYDFPMHVEDYVHRIGRTGRAQAVGDAFTLTTPEQAAEIRDIERFIGQKVPQLKLDGFDYHSAPTIGASSAGQRYVDPRSVQHKHRQGGHGGGQPRSQQSHAPQQPRPQGQGHAPRPAQPGQGPSHGQGGGQPAPRKFGGLSRGTWRPH